MNRLIRIYFLNIISLALLIYGCKKEEKSTLPILTSSTITNILGSSCQSGGNITSDGRANILERGVCWSSTHQPTISDSKTIDGSGTGIYVSSVVGLTEGTSYTIRAYATNSLGTAYGEDLSFSTLAKPLVTTSPVSNITLSSAKCGGEVSTFGGCPVTEKGICWSSTSQEPTINDHKTIDGTGVGSYISSLNDLTLDTKYYLRAYANNCAGTAYGTTIFFTTHGTVNDIDGNVYLTITIGNQEWMAENLKTTRFADGSSITLANSNSSWASLTNTTKAYCWYNNDIANRSVYGALYNCAAAMNGAAASSATPSAVQGVCPTGWHLPSENEWTILINSLGGLDVALAKIKEPGTAHWIYSNSATNESGFTALPGGYRFPSGDFCNIGVECYIWSSSKHDYGWTSAYISYYNSLMMLSTTSKVGYSVRCVKN